MSDKGKYYITTAIAYTSGKPHIGNVYEIVLADAIARYKRLTGYDVRFQTGTDEHGQKVEEKAKAAGVTPKEFVDKVSGEIKEQFDVMNVSYDKFIRTTDPYHEKQVQKIFRRFYEQGDIYKGKYEGMYCQECEAFYTKSQLTADGKCPVCGHDVKPMEEEAYFFKMSKYAPRLIKYIEEHPDFIQPESRKNEMLNNFLKPGLQDLCVSRTSFSWGIPVDFDPKHVIYVWIDALSNYITGLGYDADGNSSELYKKYWPADLHLIGKDIVRFHTIYWPIMLMALGEPLPKQVFGHPWLLTGDAKMSKSAGNVIYADDLVSLFGVDAVRFIMLHEMPFAQDGHVTYDLMIDRINSDLANNLGNLVNRTLSMENKYFNGLVSNPHDDEPVDEELKQAVSDTVRLVNAKMDELRVADAIQLILDLFSRCNKYIDETMPWSLAKDPGKSGRLATVLYNLLEAIRTAGVLLKAYLPDTADKILKSLNTVHTDYDSIQSFGQLETGITITDHPEILFARLNEKEVMAKVDVINARIAKERAVQAEKKQEVTVDDFDKLDLRVGRVVSCEHHPNADKLYVLQVDLGEDKPRQIVSGLASSYTPGQVIGKNIVVIANLKPHVFRGVESRGMLLAGKNDKEIAVVEVNGLKPGTKIC
ncbi:MAG: methionine--tRNA ligase [Erysipelotrichaceae bacterium]|uniref:Methionine--tRNA ligase n=1 Tax=Grylomicrobium aquisgranensis TaxID=2926318 RepID=A0AB35U387_9FIRM|nr:methionine--tRNA ligase [Erysipelotrichaceae bacterium]MCI1327370.1 methionine--tRNA ligase [Solobacterium sp.]MDX8418732.1 methionine--tRNA ligase [Stecheria sp. CLA-KB-P133]MCH4043551.1 methionine--tRNA ligase [Erysipelotrichaceae bacterium]MCH4120771.1 methionine--tRNA ligase [Erysipelotrichaceae bacterium]